MKNAYKYTVCIHCMTYNHEKYLADALEGFVMQKTNFPFVAVVIDDFSTDGTTDILRQYEAKYPDIIKAVYLQENYYSQHKSKKPFLEPYDSQSKYIAICEGDDYWTDPYKLQKQVDFLENHHDYSMCFHAADVILEGVDARHKGAHCENITDKEYSSTEMFSEWIVPTASIVYRRELINTYTIRHAEWLTRGDICLILKCSHTGQVWGMSERMSVYRMQPNSVSHNPKYRGVEYINLPNHFRCLYINFPKLDKEPIKWCISHAYYSRMKLENGLLKKIQDFILWSYWDPKQMIYKIIELVRRKL